jgi:UDP-N-acetylglucosamine diphosphorylase / glucose-1-phosphate thymidylyltransferase / UDP-N-acetylgalactosamine diphosphorylase / glucosamine-1-phosphate N-acetyltransferase / galactosamine-1-phosphate N-acetyltransferase
MLRPEDYFDLSEPEVAALFAGCEYVWQVLPLLGRLVQELNAGRASAGEIMAGAYISDRDVHVAEGARVEPGAYVLGPAYIGPGAVVRHGAFVRENVILMAGSVLGHAGEAKNSLFLPGAHAPHFNYVGDSVLGHKTNLGAGTKLSNLTVISEKDPATGKRPAIVLSWQSELIDTGLAKLGAILGDGVQTGCNSVLNPGVLVGPRSLIYANLSLRKGIYPADTIIKLRQETEEVHRR